LEKKFARSFFGYDEEEVEYKIRAMNKAYEESLRQLSDQLFEATSEIESLKERIRSIEDEIAQENSLNEEIKSILFSAHMKATDNVYGAIKAAESMSIKVREKVYEKEKESERIKKTLEKLTEDMESIAQCYSKALEEYKNV